jgi:hypothetical protein
VDWYPVIRSLDSDINGKDGTAVLMPRIQWVTTQEMNPKF